jgi:uncharacterized spore protein YtfJ
LKWYDWIIGGITGGTITDITKFKGMGNVPLTGGSNMDTQKADIAAKKAAAAQIAAAKKIAAAKVKADTLAASNAAKLAKASSIFDLDKIQIEAALKGKISDEETLRLQLQRAILNEDFVLAEKLQKQLEASQRATAALQSQINAIKPITNPFAAWIESLALISAQLSTILGMPINMSSSILNPNAKQPGGPGAGTQTPNSPFQPGATGGGSSGSGGGAGATTIVPTEPIYVPSSFFDLENMFPVIPKTNTGSTTTPQITVNVTNTGSVIMPDELVTTITDAVTIGLGQGLKIKPPGSLPDFE